MTKLNIGIISTASIATRFVIPAILEIPEHFTLSGIGGRDIDKTTGFAEKFGVKAYGNYDDLLNDEKLDAVYIPLPNSLHFNWTEKALRKGLHVLVEKSLGCSQQEVQLLNDLAAEKGLALMENFQFRFHTQLAYLKRILNEGRIGELRCVRSSFGYPPFSDKTNIRYQKELGGGALLDAGAYPVKIAQEFIGQDIEVVAANLSIDPATGVDIFGGAYLKQRSGNLFAEIAFGMDNFYQCNIELWGSKGKIYTNRIFTAPPGYKPEVVIETNDGKEVVHLEEDHHFKNILLHFHQLITSAGDKAKEYRQNINQARLIEEIKIKSVRNPRA